MPSPDTTTEIWKPVVGYEGFYEVSNIGRVKSLRRPWHKIPNSYPRILKSFPNAWGYPIVILCMNCRPKTRLVHSLVMEAFVGPRPKANDINHIDGNRQNNSIGNLEYCTRSQNIRHGYLVGTRTRIRRVTQKTYMTVRQVQETKRLLEMGVPGLLICKALGIKQPSVSAIKTGRMWKYVVNH